MLARLTWLRRSFDGTLLLCSLLSLCSCDETPVPRGPLRTPDLGAASGPVFAPVRPSETPSDDKLATLTKELLDKHGLAQRMRIERGLRQVAALWRPEDGDLAAFAREHFVSDEKTLKQFHQRLSEVLEQLDGHLYEAARELRRPTDTDTGPLSSLDTLLGSVDPSTHVVEDLFASKVGFVVLLNYPLTTLSERLSDGEKWSREQWAQARLALRFARRVPAEVQQRVSESVVAGERYIGSYNLFMHHLLDEKGHRLWPKGLRLISHWNLRDEIRAGYADPDGIARQRTIAKAMTRIVEQSIPASVIDNPRVDWNPFTNQVSLAPTEEIEADAPPAKPLAPDKLAEREPDRRYALLLGQADAQRRIDPYSPTAKTLIERSFQLSREIPEQQVVRSLAEICESPLVRQVAERAARQLGRKLQPHDLWFAGFRARGKVPESELDALTRKRYPTAQAFAADMPNILQKLQFAPETAKFLAEHIRVDPSRGAGHAMQALRRGDFPRLRTRIGPLGMDYKGYNIAIHELGHNVEQVFSLYEVGDTLLAGVPNNAFTEALAFVFQQRDIALLGIQKPDAATNHRRVLADFWDTWELAGVSLVEIATWHYMYDHPDATPAELRAEVVRLAKETWNHYYAPVLGGKDELLLGIYSHMIQNTLYLPDYPIGHLIAAQIEEHLAKQPAGSLGKEFQRMAKLGQVTPDLWMKNATGAPIQTAPLLRMTEAALKALP